MCDSNCGLIHYNKIIMDNIPLSDYPDYPHFINDTSWDEAAESEIAKMSRGVACFIAVLFMGYMVLGLTGNFLTILALLRCPRVRNVTAAFIISLCVADFLFCVLVLPWEVSRFLAGKWLWGEGWICTLFPLLRYWNVAVSLLSIAMITINRYIMIAHFSVYKLVYRKGWIALMIAFCWVFAFVMLLPTLLSKWGRFGFDRRLQTCSILDDNNKSPKQVLFGLGFCVPAIVIVICYSLIFFVIHRSEKRMRQHSNRGMNGAAPATGPSLQAQHRVTTKGEREARRRRNEWRITKMVLIIFIAFLVTYLPITLVKNLDKKVDYPGLHVLGYVLIYISACINPVIYVIMNRQYRQAYKTVLLCRRPRLPSLTSSHTELDKAASCRRYASLRCNTCMSQPTLNTVTSHSRPHSRPHSLPHSMHDVFYQNRKPFQIHLLGFVTPDTRSLDTTSGDNTRISSSECKDCKVIRRNHRVSCFECQTAKNTKRNTFLGVSEALVAGGRHNGDLALQGLDQSSQEAFVDHLCTEPSLTINSMSSKDDTQDFTLHNQSNGTKRSSSISSLHEVNDTVNKTHIQLNESLYIPASQTPDILEIKKEGDALELTLEISELHTTNLTHDQDQTTNHSHSQHLTTEIDLCQQQASYGHQGEIPENREKIEESDPKVTPSLCNSSLQHSGQSTQNLPNSAPEKSYTASLLDQENVLPSPKERPEVDLMQKHTDSSHIHKHYTDIYTPTHSHASFRGADQGEATSQLPHDTTPFLNDEAEIECILRQTLSSSSSSVELLDEVNRGIYEKHASWAPWNPTNTFTRLVHDKPVCLN
ncbi:uncharacterized protein [Cherax quadricarinatus]|uniref:uncharacterized protein isoform X2 n=2 Tax=Cherax quadricarinatus TaxID=27406 RepID=UPI00387EBA50